MTKALTVSGFDYSKVDKDTKGKLIALSGQLKRHGESMKGAANEMSKAIFQAHQLLAGSKGKLFNKWVESETDVALSTAYNCIHSEERARHFPIIAKLP